jgi:hypothetical protein
MYGIALAGLVPGDHQAILAVREEPHVKAMEFREPYYRRPGPWRSHPTLQLKKKNFSAD